MYVLVNDRYGVRLYRGFLGFVTRDPKEASIYDTLADARAVGSDSGLWRAEAVPELDPADACGELVEGFDVEIEAPPAGEGEAFEDAPTGTWRRPEDFRSEATRPGRPAAWGDDFIPVVLVPEPDGIDEAAYHEFLDALAKRGYRPFEAL